MPKTDVVIIGSGLAALVAASRLCMDKNVIIFTKASKENSNSILAQGGIASAISKEDSWCSHLKDTMGAGCNHNIDKMVETLVRNGPTYILELMEQGMKFDTNEFGDLLLGREGAHSYRRILHAGGDATGKALVTFMMEKIKNKVTIVEHHMAVDLILDNNRCIGVTAINQQDENITFFAEHVILATGGCGGVFEYTSNDPTIIGDGYAMAYRAGADLVDMEFVQFHPTLLHVNGTCPGLISEAVRGEGAVLVTESGRRIMENKHSYKDLAPRDIVTRVIFDEMSNGEKIFLDISMIDSFNVRFPTITTLCEKNEIIIEQGKIPIVPGAHFMMGGIKVNEHGESSLRYLYAIGEVACTGVHGANRLASNSLLETIVFANAVADRILSETVDQVKYTSDIANGIHLNGIQLPSEDEIKQMMSKNVGIVRNQAGLQAVVEYLEPYTKLTTKEVGFTQASIVRLNMITTSWLIASSALMRLESRGGHFRSDYPETMSNWQGRLINRKKQDVFVLGGLS
ncbi:L-aspartate oxidase [Bacillus salitolerans]|uniref:L-aspartate oxidase n=1 Tax=Bacillus salitolerans TaxID=1437434 RepID=A0ABW4LLJ0_9BACI